MKKTFERILKLVELFENNSQTSFARKIGCQQSTFNGYMNDGGQRKIRLTLLDDILKVYPQVSREWLYFGEGPMLRGSNIEGESSPPVASLAESMSSSAPCMEELKRENTELTKKLLAAKDELLAAKDKIIALHEENKRLAESVSAVVTPTETRRDNPQYATSVRPVTGAPERGI